MGFRFNWIRVCLFNLLLVAVAGALMRYKIGFDFPVFEQKNLLHAHSHFAFSGWISLLLMVLLTENLASTNPGFNRSAFEKIFMAYLASAYGMFFSFAAQGYGPHSISFSTASILITCLFCVRYYQAVQRYPRQAGTRWFLAALLFNILSMAGTFWLSYMMASGRIAQHTYLASVYWYLHFQYNGWFFFACMGLFANYLQSKHINTAPLARSFWYFAASCIPAYGLSVLWLQLPLPLYAAVAVAAAAQFFGWCMLLPWLYRLAKQRQLAFDRSCRLLLLAVGVALTIKLALQLGSTLPAVSRLAFGFRPIVIAYLHLVLLAFTSLFLLTYVYLRKLVHFGAAATTGLWIFTTGVTANEVILSVQGIASFSYTVVPYANGALLAAAIAMCVGLLVINTSFVPPLHKRAQP
jgi:hypothetical protein